MTDVPMPAVRRGSERRGLDPAILTFLHTLLEDYAEAHRREHELAADAMAAALVKADEKLNDLADRIREHYDTILAERDTRYGERFSASQSALSEAASSAQEAVRTALRTAREETSKTEANWVKTADATFVKIEQMQTALSKVVPREESDKIQKEQDRRMAEQDRRITLIEAAKVGRNEQRSETQMMAPWVIAVISFIGLAVTIVVAFGGKT